MILDFRIRVGTFNLKSKIYNLQFTISLSLTRIDLFYGIRETTV